MSADRINPSYAIAALNARATAVGYEVVESELVGFPFNMGSGPWCRVLRGGEACHRFAWRGEEVSTWLRFREKAAGLA